MSEFFQWCSVNSMWIQIVSLVSGIVFMLMQITQHKYMWYFGLVTAGAALVVSLTNYNDQGVWAPLWAQVVLNAYFFTMDIVGLMSWKKIEDNTNVGIHIVKLTHKATRTIMLVCIFVAPVLCFLLSLTNDPTPIEDGMAFTLSIVAQILLTRSNLEQWYFWMAADLIVIIVYANQGAWFMVALYYTYILNSIFGITHWRKHGTYLTADGLKEITISDRD